MPEVAQQLRGRAGVQIHVPFCSGSDALTSMLLTLMIHMNGDTCQNLGGEKEQSHFACPPTQFFFFLVIQDYISMKLFFIFKKPWFRGFWSSVCSGEGWLELEIDPKGTV